MKRIEIIVTFLAILFFVSCKYDGINYTPFELKEYGTFFFNFIIHLLILFGILSFMYYTYFHINEQFKTESQPDKTEGLILCGAVIFSTFLYFATKAFGISIPELLFEGMKQTTPFSFKIIMGRLFPGLLGVLVSWFIVSMLKSNDVLAKRIIIIILVLTILLFGDVYVSSFATEVGAIGVDKEKAFTHINTALLPNAIFVIGVIGYIIFQYFPTRSEQSS